MQAVILRKKLDHGTALTLAGHDPGKILSFAAGFYHVALIPYDHW